MRSLLNGFRQRGSASSAVLREQAGEDEEDQPAAPGGIPPISSSEWSPGTKQKTTIKDGTGGAARSVMLVGSAGMSTAVAATGSGNARGKAGLLVVGGDDGVHVLGMAAEFNPDTNAYFRITADDGTPIFSIEKTDAMVVGANAAGITVGESSIVIPVPVVSPDPPTMYWRQHLDSGDWTDESSPPAGATVTWTGEAGARVCTISFSGTRYNGQAQATALCRAGRPAVFLHARN